MERSEAFLRQGCVEQSGSFVATMLSASKVFVGDGTGALVFPATRGRPKARVVAMDFYHACQMETYKRGGAHTNKKEPQEQRQQEHRHHQH